MDAYGSVLEHLSRRECMRLLTTVPIGRIVYSRQALPAVEMVNFVVDGGEIVIRTDSGDKLAAAANGAVVAFEADSVDFASQAGWSVTVVGQCRAVTDDEHIRRLRSSGLRSWAPGNRQYFIVISSTFVNGRRIRAPQTATAASRTPPLPDFRSELWRDELEFWGSSAGAMRGRRDAVR